MPSVFAYGAYLTGSKQARSPPIGKLQYWAHSCRAQALKRYKQPTNGALLMAVGVTMRPCNTAHHRSTAATPCCILVPRSLRTSLLAFESSSKGRTTVLCSLCHGRDCCQANVLCDGNTNSHQEGSFYNTSLHEPTNYKPLNVPLLGVSMETSQRTALHQSSSNCFRNTAALSLPQAQACPLRAPIRVARSINPAAFSEPPHPISGVSPVCARATPSGASLLAKQYIAASVT